MARYAYKNHNFQGASLDLLENVLVITKSYGDRGYVLTLRQLYYQLVARDVIPNDIREYKKLGTLLKNAREAGYVDWDAIEDRTRNLKELSHWVSPGHILAVALKQYRRNKWDGQPNYVEVWVEKEALASVIRSAAEQVDVPFIACRGFMSVSEMRSAAMRMVEKQRLGRHCVIVHLGDHDPSGIDMTRDIEDRINWFCSAHNPRYSVDVNRIALNMDQIERYNPPPDPAKTTDSRYQSYLDEYGDLSWELDALDPDILIPLVVETVESYRDDDIYQQVLDSEAADIELLTTIVEMAENGMENDEEE